jgi:8-oxo-dGTP diphosphatase
MRSVESFLVVRNGRGELRCRVGDRLLLPGGPVGQGEHPADAASRLAAEQTGRTLTVGELLDVYAVVDDDGHHDRLIYAATGAGDGGPAAVWVPGDGRVDRDAVALHGPVPSRVGHQRFAAYGRVRDPAGRVLLTLIAAGYPGAGHWHLPGGGTDPGEQPCGGLLRELAEETDQQGRITALLGASSRHLPAAVGPEGVPMDWHTIRVHFDVMVDNPRLPTVTELPGGSTERAAWFAPRELGRLRLSEVAASLLTDLSS